MGKKLVCLALAGAFWATLAAEEAAPKAAAASLKATVKVGTSIENKELVGEAAEFPSTTPTVTAWSLIEGASTPTEIKHVWSLNGKEVSSIALQVQSSRYRTNSRKTISGQPGSWNVKVVDADGKELASVDFKVSAPAQ